MIPEKAETRVFPDVRKPVSENIADFKFFEIMKQVARKNSTVGHDRKLPHPSCTAHSRWQGIFVKAGGVYAVDLYIRIFIFDPSVKIKKSGIGDGFSYPCLIFA